MREYKLVEAALHAMGDDEDMVKVIMDGQTKSTDEDMKTMKDANNGAEGHSDKTVCRQLGKVDTEKQRVCGEPLALFF